VSPADSDRDPLASEPLAVDALRGPEPAPPDEEEHRRHLRLVQRGEARRANRRRLLVSIGIGCAGAVCLTLVALHVLIAENQFKLDRLQQQAATEQVAYEKLRLQVALLEAPARIVSEAEGRLGMVQPASVSYLPATSSTPVARGGTGQGAASGATAADPSGVAGPTSDQSAAGVIPAPQGDADWPSVKPYLSGTP